MYNARKPYYKLKLSMLDFYTDRVRFIARSREVESQFEKPYLSGEYPQMHLNIPTPPPGPTPPPPGPWNPIPPVPVPPGPTPPGPPPIIEFPVPPIPPSPPYPYWPPPYPPPATWPPADPENPAPVPARPWYPCFIVCFPPLSCTDPICCFPLQLCVPPNWPKGVDAAYHMDWIAWGDVGDTSGGSDMLCMFKIWGPQGTWDADSLGRTPDVNVLAIDPCGNKCTDRPSVNCDPCLEIEDVTFALESGEAYTTIPDSIAGVSVDGGMAPYEWSAAGQGIEIMFGRTWTTTNYIVTDETACGEGSVSVTEYCGSSDSADVKVSAGEWVLDCELSCQGAQTYQPGCESGYSSYSTYLGAPTSDTGYDSCAQSDTLKKATQLHVFCWKCTEGAGGYGCNPPGPLGICPDPPDCCGGGDACGEEDDPETNTCVEGYTRYPYTFSNYYYNWECSP